MLLVFPQRAPPPPFYRKRSPACFVSAEIHKPISVTPSESFFAVFFAQEKRVELVFHVHCAFPDTPNLNPPPYLGFSAHVFVAG